MELEKKIKTWEEGCEIVKHFHNRTIIKTIEQIQNKIKFDSDEPYQNEQAKQAAMILFNEVKASVISLMENSKIKSI